MCSHQLNFKNDRPVLLFNTIRYRFFPPTVSYFSFKSLTVDRELAKGASGKAARNEGGNPSKIDRDDPKDPKGKKSSVIF